MRKIFLSSILICFASLVFAQPKLFDKSMILQSCNINIKANDFTATTYMELEFYNPGMQEIEGLQLFQLAPGQVVTFFQLMLNGQYRDGSIEEKWKATNVYNTIVGKRVDPAILKLENGNTYSLHIYPIPAKSTRKVTITIQEILPAEKNELHYNLPFEIKDTCEKFYLNIQVNCKSESIVRTGGLIANHRFSENDSERKLNWNAKQLLIKKGIEFFIPLPGITHSICSQNGEQKYFAVRHHINDTSYEIQPSDLTVFWDVSGSSERRNIKQEISFLQQLINYHHISKLTILPFNNRIKDTITFFLDNKGERSWQQYLNNLEYSGATQLGCIDISKMKSDMFILFTDGINTYGKRKPNIGDGLIFCVNSNRRYNTIALNKIVASNGGKVINLSATGIFNAVKETEKANKWLLNVRSVSGKSITEQAYPIRTSKYIFLNGSTIKSNDTLLLYFGTGNKITQIDTLVIKNNECKVDGVERINMLNNFIALDKNEYWENILEFGLKEKIVTNHTAFIVLEKASDYVKYNISPPKDLEDECKQLNFVKKDTRWERRQIHKADEYERLNNVVNAYNTNNKKFDATTSMLALTSEEFNKDKLTVSETQQNNETASVSTLQGRVMGVSVTGSNALQEVVVTGYGTSLRKNLTGSVVYITTKEISTSQTVEQALQGKIAGVQIANASGTLGSTASISIRGTTSINGNNQPLFVLDGMPVSGNINQFVNTTDIDNITVLKDAASTTIYGSRGVNGVILVNTKKGRRYNYYDPNYKKYKLSDVQDIDYMLEWKEAPASEKKLVYEQLAEQHSGEPGFYMDMADLFFKFDKEELAKDILMNASEVAEGNLEVVVAMAYILESWNDFKEAANVYEQLIEDNPHLLQLRRNLAWAYYRQGLYQQAVNTFYDGLQLDLGLQENANLNLKTIML